MTQDEKVNALLKAAIDQAEINRGAGRTGHVTDALNAAIAAFEPEPELEYTMPEWQSLRKSRANYIEFSGNLGCSEDQYNALRHLTRVPKKPKSREWWINVYPNDPALYAHADRETATKALSVDGETVLVREVMGDTP